MQPIKNIQKPCLNRRNRKFNANGAQTTVQHENLGPLPKQSIVGSQQRKDNTFQPELKHRYPTATNFWGLSTTNIQIQSERNGNALHAIEWCSNSICPQRVLVVERTH